MERPPSTPEEKSPKQRKTKKPKPPIKVVYISNPMRIKATVDEFRAVVQELTGQDSDVADFSKYAGSAADDEPPPPPASDRSSSPGLGVSALPPPLPQLADLGSDDAYGRSFHDYAVSPGMFDDLPGFLPSSPLYYGP